MERLWQLRNLENRIGCVQCGMPTKMITPGGRECCGNQACKKWLARLEGPLGIDDILRHELRGVRLSDLDV